MGWNIKKSPDEKSVLSNWEEIMKRERSIPNPDIKGYVPESAGTEYGVSYIGTKLNK